MSVSDLPQKSSTDEHSRSGLERWAAASAFAAEQPGPEAEPEQARRSSRSVATTLNKAKFDWQRAFNRAIVTKTFTFNEIAVAQCIQDHAKYNEAWPSNERIADQVGVSVRTVIRATKRLEAIGWISSEMRLNSSKLYKLTIPEGSPDESR